MQNQLLIQYFHWYYHEAQNLWTKVAAEAEHLKELGVTTVWLPPPYKASTGGYSVGYDVYDLFDLGEFDQKGSVNTKYGSKEEYLNAIAAMHDQQISVLIDVVFNHKAGGDELEKIPVRTVNEEDRNQFTSDVFEIEAWTKFTFPGRAGKYSEFIWDKECFSGIDWAEDLKQTAIYSIQNEAGEGFEEVTSTEFGNYDYLMFNDIEFRNEAVKNELKYWGEWIIEQAGVDGFRLDAVKHINPHFLAEWIHHLNSKFNREFFMVAENWDIKDTKGQEAFIAITNGNAQLFDSLLHHNFYLASTEEFDMQALFENTLVKVHPDLAVTFVDNHDSQPLQALESYIEFWFRPLAYAIILLRLQGIPCLFFPDLYGAEYEDKDEGGNQVTVELIGLPELDNLCHLRAHLAYGEQIDYLDHPNCIGWTRLGDDEHPNSGLAVLLSNGDEGRKRMKIDERFANRTFIDAMGYRQDEITLNENGEAEFYCNAKSVSVWILKEA
ncbi:alpha-amylase [Pedobacter sp. MW01-1-1]|uniref:alpha-amylase n=1 Tax=Pedobacter sp. MW01-1-1 TaxID=3383027 RepID=UPI003FEDE1BC